MPVEICDADCEEHGIPFAHRIVNAGIRKSHESTIYTFLVVCAYCGHWIDRPMPQCGCPASCHMEARSGEPYGTILVIKTLPS